MAKVTVTVCDKCGSQEGVRHFEIREGGKKAQMDLCGEHNKELVEVFEEALPAPQTPTKRASRPRKVTTMEEIEALKAK